MAIRIKCTSGECFLNCGIDNGHPKLYCMAKETELVKTHSGLECLSYANKGEMKLKKRLNYDKEKVSSNLVEVRCNDTVCACNIEGDCRTTKPIYLDYPSRPMGTFYGYGANLYCDHTNDEEEQRATKLQETNTEYLTTLLKKDEEPQKDRGEKHWYTFGK